MLCMGEEFMASLTFDTLKFVKKLRDAGFDEQQAEAVSEAFREAQHTVGQDLATKSDLKELELRLETRLEGLRGELTLLKWMQGFVLAGILTLILKTFFT